MATFHDRTLAPKFQGRLLRGAGPCRVLTSDEMVSEVEADQPEESRLPANYPDEIGLVAARTLHSRRRLTEALEYGFALLDALDMPPLALDVIDEAIAHLDALDAPDEDLEPYLAGWFDPVLNPSGEREDEPEHDEDDDLAEAEPDKEPSIGWPNDAQAVLEHRFEATDYDVEAVNEDGDDCGEAHAPWWDRIGHPSMEMFHV